jgi:hypothetical protein
MKWGRTETVFLILLVVGVGLVLVNDSIQQDRMAEYAAKCEAAGGEPHFHRYQKMCLGAKR